MGDRFKYNPFTNELDVVVTEVADLTGLTAGSVPFGSSTGGLAEDNANLF